MINKFDTLYARDSKGKVLQWNIEVQNNFNSVDIKISYGEFNGGQAIKWQRDIKGKNIGKSNETNPFEQAISEAESAINSKKRKGYLTLEEAKEQYIEPIITNTGGEIPVGSFAFTDFTEDVKEKKPQLELDLEKYIPLVNTDKDGNAKPMKAQQYYRSKKNWTDPNGIFWEDRKYYYIQNPYVEKEPKAIITKFPCMGQPKINGARSTSELIDEKSVTRSKEGLIYDLPHIKSFLENNKDIFDLASILDGELYIHGESLQTISSAIKAINLNTPRVKLILFDLAIKDLTNKERWDIIKNNIKPKLAKHFDSPVEIIAASLIKSDAEAQAYTDYCIKKGYEGAIFRQLDAPYAFGKRPQTMTKLKRVIDTEFKIIDVVPQKKDRSKGNFVCITKEGKTFEVNPKGSDEYKRRVLTEKEYFKGKDLTCFFYEWTDDNKPLHISNNVVRDYE